MSGSALTRAVTRDGEPAIVKVTVLDSDTARDQAYRELAVYAQLAPVYAIPTPRLIAHHRAATWLAVALAHHDPAPAAPQWSADDWGDLARILGRLHRDVRRVPNSFRRDDEARARSHGDLKTFARRLWHGPGDAARVQWVLQDLELLEQVARSGPASFVHGDCHIGNVLRGANRQPMLVDWQSARVGPSAADLAFAFTRAVPTGAAIPRDLALSAYCDEAGVDPAQTEQQVTAHQLLTLVREYPEFSGFLSTAEVAHLREGLDRLLSRWRSRG
ncbi:aminoglycoside phosphotransferase family protein [Promicromonospora xylanilytica]